VHWARVSLWLLASVLAVVLASPAPSYAGDAGWATAQAAELTRQGQGHAGRGEVDVAARRFLDAIGFDPTYGPAYLALGSLHERAGDPREGERAYAVGIDHVPSFVDGYLARGRLRARQRRFAEAISDIEAATRLRPDDLALLRELASLYVGVNALPAALAVTRRMETVADGQRDATTQSQAHVRARALALLVGEIDPVAAGLTSRGEVRRAIALHAARR
jgi:tetratricopeptide (TPR) repeat protein